MTSDVSRTVLITGFGPFGPHTDNPSGQLAELLDGEETGGVRLVGRRFTTSTVTVADELARALDETSPDAVICLGLAPGRPLVSLERMAVNLRDFGIPDAAGDVVTDEPVDADGPDGLFTGLPVRAIMARWRRDEVPAHVSYTAGTYLCNQLFYLVCRHGRRLGIPAGFVHVPDTPHSASVSAAGADPGPTMELSRLADAVRGAAEVCVGAAADADEDGARLSLGAVS